MTADFVSNPEKRSHGKQCIVCPIQSCSIVFSSLKSLDRHLATHTSAERVDESAQPEGPAGGTRKRPCRGIDYVSSEDDTSFSGIESSSEDGQSYRRSSKARRANAVADSAGGSEDGSEEWTCEGQDAGGTSRKRKRRNGGGEEEVKQQSVVKFKCAVSGCGRAFTEVRVYWC